MRRGDGAQGLLGGTHSQTSQSEGDNAAESALSGFQELALEMSISRIVAESKLLPTTLKSPRAQSPSDPSEKRLRRSRRVSGVQAVISETASGMLRGQVSLGQTPAVCIDAVCIDQKDEKIRNQQVRPMMCGIHDRATRAFSFPGECRCDNHSRHSGKDCKSPEDCGRCNNYDRNRQRCWHLLGARAVDGLSIVGAGLATAFIISFDPGRGEDLSNRVPRMESLTDEYTLPGTCSPLPFLQHPPPTLRCPNLPMYMAAISLYSVAGVFQVAQEPRYWADCALVAVLVAVVTGALHGIRPMLDALVLGGFLSLVCCRGIAWFASSWVRD